MAQPKGKGAGGLTTAAPLDRERDTV